MITKYIVLNETAKALMILRPYQFYATEAIIERVKTTTKFGYIWHTTGSGKTLTSFKTAQILTNLPNVHKVVFVVDRKDLDYQTTKEFNGFSKGSIDGTNNTDALVKQLAGNNKLIVTTIQKLNAAISKARYLGKIEKIKQERIVFIFDECHRSQFGKTHDIIKKFFANCQMFGFTGTPIFQENAGSNEFGKRTTDMLFGDRLHKYVITDAIRDENVLKFSIEYIRTFKNKEIIADSKVEAIDEEEVMNAPERLNIITDYIIANHDRKTHNREFTSIFCVSSIQNLVEYYKLFQQRKEEGSHNLKVATIFSYQSNEEDFEAEGTFATEETVIAAEPKEIYQNEHSRDNLEAFIGHYNQMFSTNFTTKDSQSFYNYYNDISKRVKQKEVDVLLVVNMFLTGFDSKSLNTLYVDKNLKYHGLFQAFSRTNRILNEIKSQGNIVCFRNLKQDTDNAIELFSRLEHKNEIILQPYEDYIVKFNNSYIRLLQMTPTVNSVNNLKTEEDELEFIKEFRELIRLKNVLNTFTEFKFEDLSITEQQFEDYKSKYLDLYDKAKSFNQKQKVSILDDIDFELELIHRDEINVTYILKLIAKLNNVTFEERENQKKSIVDLISGDIDLRSKRKLIEKFIEQNLPIITNSDAIPDEFNKFWNIEKEIALNKIIIDENLDPDKLEDIIGKYIFTEMKPMRDDIVGMMNTKPGLKQRGTTAERITDKIYNFVNTFISGITNL